MPFNLNNLFAAIGRVGRTLYLINQSQSLQPVPLNELSAFSYIDQFWLNQLTASYDQLIRIETQPMSAWAQAAQNILIGMVSQYDPSIGTSLPNCLQFLLNQMNLQSATVKKFNTGFSFTPDGTNVGIGNIVATLVRGDGIALQNIVPETGTLLITADSYLGGATVGQEPWQYIGQPNVSSLGTGVSVSVYDWDWPQGSAVIAGGNSISAAQYSSTSGNYLSGGDFAVWTGGVPNFWNLVSGTITQNHTNQLGGSYCVQFNPGVNAELTQQFGPGTTTTGTTAGNNAALVPYASGGYLGNLWFKASAPLTGTATISLVDSSGAVINDQQGTPNSTVVNLASVPTANYGPYSYAIRTPIMIPANGIMRLDIKIAGLTGGNLYWDWNGFCSPVNLNTGLSSIQLFSNPAAIFVAQPEPDNWSVVFTNDWGGAQFLATWQALLLRLFGTPSLIVPYSATPSITDTLITAA